MTKSPAAAVVIDFEEFETSDLGEATGIPPANFLAEDGITNVTVSDGAPLRVIEEFGPGSLHELNPGHGNFFAQFNGEAPVSARTLTLEFADGLKRFGFRRIGGSNLSSSPHWTATALDGDGQPINVPFGEPGGGFILLRDPATFELTAPEGKTIASFTFHMPSQLSTFGVTPIDDIELEFDNEPPEADAGGPYTITEGNSLSLNASGSSDPDSNPLTYRWDVNGDGSFDEDVTGAQPTLAWSELQEIGIPNGVSTRTVTVEVSDGMLIDEASTTLTVNEQSDSVLIDFEQFETGDFLEAAGIHPADFLADFGITSVTVSDGGPLKVIAEQGPGSLHELNPGHGNFFAQFNGAAPVSARTMTLEFADGLKRFGFRRIGGSNLSSSPHWTATALDGDGQPINVPFGESGGGFILLRDPATFELTAPEGKTIASFTFHMPSQLSTFGVTPIDDIQLEFEDGGDPPEDQAIQVDLNAGVLTIDVVDPVNTNLTIRLDDDFNPPHLVIDEPNVAIGTDVGTGNGTQEVRVPVDTGGGIDSISILGGSLDDRLTIDFSGGGFPVPITYQGGAEATGGDSLVIAGNTNPFETATYVFDNENDGSISLFGDGVTTNINYTGLEPIIGGTAEDVILEYRSAAAEQITLSNDSSTAGNTFIDSTAGESLSFPNPTDLLRIETSVGGGDGADELTVLSLDAGWSADLTFHGDADDTVRLGGTAALNTGDGDISLTANLIRMAVDLQTAGDVTLDGPVLLDASVAINAHDVTFEDTVDAQPAMTLFDGDGSDIQNATGVLFPTAHRQPVLDSGSLRFDIVSSSVDDKLIELPLLPAGELPTTEPTVISIAADITGLSGDHDPQVGLSDGTNAVLFMRLGTEGRAREGDDGNPLGSPTFGVLDPPISYPLDSAPDLFTGIFTLDAQTSLAGTIGSASGSHTFSRVLDRSQPISLAFFANNGNEGHQVNRFTVTELHRTGLTINTSGGGVTKFEGTVGGTGPLASLTTNADGQTHLVADIHTSGSTVDFHDPVLLLADTLISETGPGNVTFHDSVDSADGSNLDLIIDTNGGSTIFHDAVGGDALGNASDDGGLGTLTVDGVQINGGLVKTTGAQTYLGPVIVGSDATLLAEEVDFEGGADSVSGTVDLTITPSSADANITVGAEDDGGVSVLDITNTDLAALAGGFASITIGDANSGSGAVDVDSSVFVDNINIVGGSIAVTEMDATGQSVTLTARSGAITDGGEEGSDVTAATLALFASAGIGTSADAMESAVANLEADGGSGGVYVSNAGGLTIGGASDALTGALATGGDITITANSPLTASEDVVNSGGGNIDLTAASGFEIGTGALTFLEEEVGGNFGISISPDGRHVYAATGHLHVFARDEGTGELTFVQRVDSVGSNPLRGVLDALVSPDGKHVYVNGHVFQRDESTGELTFVESYGGALGIAISPSGDRFFTANGRLSVFARDPASGELTFQSQSAYPAHSEVGAVGIDKITVSPDGQHAYGTSFGGQAIVVFQLNGGASPTITQIEIDDENGIDGLGGPTEAVVSPDGRHVYVSAAGDNALNVFARNEATGLLTFVEFHQNGVDGVVGLGATRHLAISPDGAHIYATAFSDPNHVSLAIFGRNEQGSLSFLPPPDFTLGGGSGVTVSPDGKSVYVGGSGRVYAYERDALVPGSPDDDLTLNANVTASGGNGSITLNAGSDIHLATGTVSAAGSGTVALSASTATEDGAITTASGVAAAPHVIGETVTLQGDVAPGSSPGQLVIDGDVTFGGSDDFVVELHGSTSGSGHDQLRVEGANRVVSLNGATLNLSLGGTYEPAIGDQLVIVDNVDSGSTLSGTFADLADGHEVVIDDLAYVIDYSGGIDNNDVVLTVAVPNQAPIADAGGSYSVVEGDSIRLRGAGSSDDRDSALRLAVLGLQAGAFNASGTTASASPPAISGNGQYVAFSASAGSLGVGGNCPAVGVTNIATEFTEAVSLNNDDLAFNLCGSNVHQAISHDGRYVAFQGHPGNDTEGIFAPRSDCRLDRDHSSRSEREHRLWRLLSAFAFGQRPTRSVSQRPSTAPRRQ